MYADALLLVVISAFLHALWNFFAKKVSGGLPFVWLYCLVSLLCTFPFALHAWFQAPHLPGAPAWSAILASSVVHVAYCIWLQTGYRQSDFSVVYTVARGTGPALSVLGAVLVLGETPSLAGWAGIASILLGVFLVAGMHRIVHRSGDRMRRGLMWGALTGTAIAAYTVIDGWAMKTLSMSPAIYYPLGLAVRALLLAPFALRNPATLRMEWVRNRRHILAVGVLSPLAYSLVLFAMVHAPLSLVAPVREVSMLISTLVGARLLREDGVLPRLAGAACMLLGIAMLTRT